MPISRLLGGLIAKALDYPFARTASFHREVVRYHFLKLIELVGRPG
jgi:hypothetical protein